MDKKTIKATRGKIYDLLHKEFNLSLDDLRKTDLRKLLKQLSQQSADSKSESPRKPVGTIRVWRSED